VLKGKRPEGRNRGNAKAQHTRHEQRKGSHWGCSSKLTYRFHDRRRHAAQAAKGPSGVGFETELQRIQRFADGHLTDMEVHEWWLDRPLSDGQVYVQAEVPLEVLEDLSSTADEDAMAQTLEHAFARCQAANVLQHYLKTHRSDEPLDYRTDEDRKRSDTPDRNAHYPGAKFNLKYGGIVPPHGLLQQCDGNLRHYLDEQDIMSLIAREPSLTDVELRQGTWEEGQLKVLPPKCCNGFHQQATSQPAVDIVTANHGCAFYSFDTPACSLPMSASEALSYSWGGDRDGDEFQVEVDLDQEGYQHGRIFSANLRSSHSVFSTSCDVCYGWNREDYEDAGFGKYVPDQGFYRPGPWISNPMPKWINPDEFAPSPYHARSQSISQIRRWPLRPGGFEGQFHRDEGASRLYMVFNLLVKSAIWGGFKEFTRKWGSGYGQRPPPEARPKKSAGFRGARPTKSAGFGGPKKDAGSAHGGNSYDNCESSAVLQATNRYTLKSNMIQYGVPDSNHEHFYKNWDKAACKLWFFDYGRQMTPAQVSSQAIYLHCTQGVHLGKPLVEDGHCYYVDNDDGSRIQWSLANALQDKPAMPDAEHFKQLVQGSRTYERYAEYMHNFDNSATRHLGYGCGSFVQNIISAFGRCETLNEAIDYLNDNRAQATSVIEYLFEEHHPGPANLWNAYLDFMNFPITHTAHTIDRLPIPLGGMYPDTMTTDRAPLNAKSLQFLPPQDSVYNCYGDLKDSSNSPPVIIDTGADAGICSRKWAVQISAAMYQGGIEGVGGLALQRITEEGYYPFVFCSFVTSQKCCVLIPVKIFETPGDVPILGLGALRHAGFSLGTVDQSYEDKLIAPSTFPENTYTYKYVSNKTTRTLFGSISLDT